MNDAFYIAATGMRSEERAVQTIANNIANINTPSFKRSDVRFSQLMAPPAGSGLEDDMASAAAIGGVRFSEAPRDMRPGDVRKTGNSLDIAIQGEGFIELLGPDQSPMLWRGGRLRIADDGQLQTADGMLLKAAIRAPAGLQDILIDQSGSVSALVDGARQSIGTIDLVMASAHDLKDLGGGLFQATSAASLLQTTPGADGSGLLAQGYIENSNVDLSNEMVSLMVMQRAFAANSQVIQAADQLMAIANGLKR